MAKLSLINRDQKRRALVKKYAKKREALVAIIDDAKASDETRFAARLKLQQLPRNANPTRLRSRCAHDGPPARVLPQVRPRPQQAARVRHARRDPGHRQGQLVRGEANEHD